MNILPEITLIHIYWAITALLTLAVLVFIVPPIFSYVVVKVNRYNNRCNKTIIAAILRNINLNLDTADTYILRSEIVLNNPRLGKKSKFLEADEKIKELALCCLFEKDLYNEMSVETKSINYSIASFQTRLSHSNVLKTEAKSIYDQLNGHAHFEY